ncbi:MAG: hypothetical protein ACOCXJ_05280 [Planctomycetota bacterium]
MPICAAGDEDRGLAGQLLSILLRQAVVEAIAHRASMLADLDVPEVPILVLRVAGFQSVL